MEQKRQEDINIQEQNELRQSLQIENSNSKFYSEYMENLGFTK